MGILGIRDRGCQVSTPRYPQMGTWSGGDAQSHGWAGQGAQVNPEISNGHLDRWAPSESQMGGQGAQVGTPGISNGHLVRWTFQ